MHATPNFDAGPDPWEDPRASRVLVVSADDGARDTWLSLIRGAPGLEASGQVHDGPTAATECRDRQPDVVVLDFALAGRENGLSVARRLLRLQPTLQILLVATEADSRQAVKALKCGVRGFLL